MKKKSPTKLLVAMTGKASAAKAAEGDETDLVSALVDRDEFRRRLNERNPDLGDTTVAMIS